MLIFEIETRGLGFIQFKIIEEINRIGEWGFYLSPQAPPGTGSVLGQDGLSYAFQDLKLQRLYGKAIVFNQKSIKFHKKLGFSFQDTLKEHFFDGKKNHDVIVFSLFNEGWINSEIGKGFGKF